MTARGIEKLGYADDGCGVLFAEYATSMPEIAKLDAFTKGFYAFPAPGEGENVYKMDVNDERYDDMVDTMEWLVDAGHVEDYEFDGDVLFFTLSYDALDAMEIDPDDVADFPDNADIAELVAVAFEEYTIQASF